MAKTETQELRCSFCGKRETQARLIAGPGVYICSDCGTDEAFIDTQGDVMPPEEWFLNSFKQEE